MTRSQDLRASASSIAGAVSTRSYAGSTPARRSARTISSASSAESSTIRRFIAVMNCWSCRGRLLIKHQPVEPELPHRFDELVEVDRLAHVTVGAQAVAMHDVLLLFGGSQDDHGQQPGPLVRAQLGQDLESVQLGQLQVEEDDLRQ